MYQDYSSLEGITTLVECDYDTKIHAMLVNSQNVSYPGLNSVSPHKKLSLIISQEPFTPELHEGPLFYYW